MELFLSIQRKFKKISYVDIFDNCRILRFFKFWIFITYIKYFFSLVKGSKYFLCAQSQKCCNISVAKFTATLFQLHIDETPGVVFQDKPAAEVENASGEPRQARRVFM